MAKTPTFTVDRAKWLVGNYEANTYLRSAERGTSGKMCCLGFYGRQVCGLKAKDITNVTNLSLLPKLEGVPGLEPFVRMEDATTFADDIMVINDDGELPLRDREKQLKAKFAEQGIVIKFTGTYPKRLLAKVAAAQ